MNVGSTLVQLVASLGIAAGVAGCSNIPWGPRVLAACPGVLRPIDQIEGEFVLQHRVRIRTGDLDIPMQIAVQKISDELVVIGFNPIGAKLFSIVQRSRGTEVDALPRAIMPVSPLSVLRDLHRIRFLAAPSPATGDGTSSRSFDGTVVHDTWRAGVLIRREVTTQYPSLPTTLRFEPGSQRVAIENPSCEYSAEWETVSEQEIL
jgi:hypothetical protein